MLEAFFIFQVTDRRKMVALKLLDDLLWTTHFLLIGGYTAALTSAIAVFRELIFYYKGKKRWAESVWWAMGFTALFAACAPLTWANAFSIFPALASAISTWSFWVNRSERIKLLQIPGSVCSFIYNVVYSSYSGILTQIITLLSIVIFFVRAAVKKQRSRYGKFE